MRSDDHPAVADQHRSTGMLRRTLARTTRLARRARRSLARRLVESEVAVVDGSRTYRFVCLTNAEEARARSILAKEPGTVAWLESALRPSDVFFDIGANIGVFTVFAGCRLGPDGCVYAFEPHTPNACALLHNILANRLCENARVVTAALSQRNEFRAFNYRSLHRGTSASQFGRTLDEEGAAFVPATSEIKYGCTVDRLVEQGIVRPPDLVKIDVDGLEHEILIGMLSVLSASRRPRHVQIEVGALTAGPVRDLMTGAGYRLQQRHWSGPNARRAAAAADADSVYPCNLIFAPAERGP
jgi:FkbM family methyltransferase